MNYDDEVRALSLLHGIIFLGAITLLIIFYFLIGDSSVALSFELSWRDGMVLMVSLIIPAIYQWVYRNRLPRVKAIEDKAEQWQQYRDLQIKRYALTEAPALLTGVYYFYGSQSLFLVVALTYALVLASYRPSAYRIESELDIKTGL